MFSFKKNRTPFYQMLKYKLKSKYILEITNEEPIKSETGKKLVIEEIKSDLETDSVELSSILNLSSINLEEQRVIEQAENGIAESFAQIKSDNFEVLD